MRDGRSLLAHWQRLSLRARGFVVLSVPLAALLGMLYGIYGLDAEANNAALVIARVSSAREEILQLAILQRDLAAREAAEQSLDRLGPLVEDDERSAEAVEALRQDLREDPRPGMDRLRGNLDVLNREQARRLNAADEARRLARRKLRALLIGGAIFGPLLAICGHLLVTGRLRIRLRAIEDNARRLAHDFPLEPFPAGADEVSGLARQIESAAYLLRKRERELRESEQRYRELFDRAPIPYEETDRDGVVARFNQAVCALLKCPPDRILGSRAWDFVAPEQQEAFRAAMMERLTAGMESGPYESEYYLEDGSRISVEIREMPIRDETGEVIGVCRSLLDVTERNLAAMAARKVEQYAMELRNKNEQLGRALDAARSATVAKSRFLAAISHELRTPLNGIIGFSELMHDGRVGPVSPEHREFLGDILTSARHLLRLINDILDLSKIEAGKMTFRPERRFVHALVYEVCDVVRALADKKDIRLDTDVPQDVVVVLDSSRFKQVLYNYLSNAVKFTGPGGKVLARVALEGNDRFCLEVADTGIGIEPAELPLLFQEFQQLPNSRGAEQGTGLGLALTRNIVEAQGGKVAVRSRKGEGSVFSAVLPLDTTPFIPRAEDAKGADRALGIAPDEAASNPA